MLLFNLGIEDTLKKLEKFAELPPIEPIDKNKFEDTMAMRYSKAIDEAIAFHKNLKSDIAEANEDFDEKYLKEASEIINKYALPNGQIYIPKGECSDVVTDVEYIKSLEPKLKKMAPDIPIEEWIKKRDITEEEHQQMKKILEEKPGMQEAAITMANGTGILNTVRYYMGGIDVGLNEKELEYFKNEQKFQEFMGKDLQDELGNIIGGNIWFMLRCIQATRE